MSIRFSRLLIGILFLGHGVCQQVAGVNSSAGPADVPKKPIIFDLSAIDNTVDPCQDFYRYACGNWRKNNPVPSDQIRWGRFNELADRNNYLLYLDLKSAAEAPKTPLQKKYGDYFAACMDVDHIDGLGARPIQPILDAIDSLKNNKRFAKLSVELDNRFAVELLFDVYVQQDQKDSTQQIGVTQQSGLTLPDRDYYLSTDARSQKIREQYVSHITKMFALLGDSPEKAAAEAVDVLRIETALAKGSQTRVEMRDPANRYHIMTLKQLDALSPSFDWKEFLVGIGLPQAQTLNVVSPGYVKTVEVQLESENVQALKSYLRWHVLHSTARALSRPFEKENFNFFNAILNGQKEDQPRWKQCTRATDFALGEAVGQDWVQQNFPAGAKNNTEKLVQALETALAEDIKSLSWMSPDTKSEALKKLNAIRDKIGYPDTWRDYSKLQVKRDDYFGNRDRTLVFYDKRNHAKFGKPVDEKEWNMTPPTVNAYYDPPMNDINFPAGIIQPPFFDNSLDAAVNFGGIGVVIGHEMTHGFDDQGSKYDSQGNVRRWWTDEDKKKFDERTECEADEYSGFEAAPGQNLNGRLTLGENTADNGGLRIAYQALMATLEENAPSSESGYVNGRRDGYTPAQRFFISFAQVWCENDTEQSVRVQVKTDPHSTPEWRVKGALRNFDEFGKAFGCKVGQPMMPQNSCRVW